MKRKKSLCGESILQDSFDYRDNTEFNAAGWTGSNGVKPADPTYVSTDDGANQLVSLNNRFMTRDLGTTLTENFSVTIDVQHSSPDGRQQWVLVSSAPDEAGFVSGYAFSWYSNPSTVYITRYEGRLADYSPSDRKGSFGADLTGPAAGSLNSLEIAPAQLSQLETFTFSWDHSGALTLSAKGHGELAATRNTDYSSFSAITISGNTSGFFDNLEVTASLPQN